MNLKYLYTSKVTIVPTWRMWLSLVVVAIAMFASINFQTSVLHWFVYTMLFIFSGSIVFNLSALSEIQNEWAFKQSIFVNEDPDIELKISGTIPHGVVMQNKQILDRSKTLPIGKHIIKNLSLYTEYPLGYFKANIPLSDIGPIWVYPQPINHSDKNVGMQKNESGDMFKTYQPGDSPKKILKKTLSLPSTMWKSKKDETTAAQAINVYDLNWMALDKNLTDKQKIEQLSYFIKQMSDTQNFTMVLPAKRLKTGKGAAHKHAAWRLLVEEWTTRGL